MSGARRAAAVAAPPVPKASELASRVREEARMLGFELIGVARPEPSAHLRFYERWLAEGRHGGMAYLARPEAVARRADLRRTLATVRSVVVVAMGYHTEPDPDDPPDPTRGVIARYARGRDYHRVIKRRLLALLERVAAHARCPVAGRVYVDTGPLLERELGQRAGLGWFGKNTMLIHPRRGSWHFLGALLLDLDLEPDPPFTADHCGNCSRCLDACPTGALLGRDSSGAPVMDATRCISYLTIEHRGPIPSELRPAIGNRVYGCDICQEVCPFNSSKFVQLTPERDYRADWRDAPDRPGPSTELPGTESPPLVELMRMTREEWDVFSRGSAIRRVGYAGFKRNVAVAIGNWLVAVEEPPPEAVAALRDVLEEEEPLVREHAA